MTLIDINIYRLMQSEREALASYRQKLQTMPKFELLQELLSYHDSYIKNPQNFQSTLKGQQLIEVLEERAELKELKDLTLEFKTKLQSRLQQQLRPVS